MVNILGYGPSWNPLRYAADLSHLISIVLLLYTMWRKKSCSGISLKTQFLFLIVHITRYCNGNFFAPPIYNIIFKLFYLVTAVAIIWAMMGPLARTSEIRHDTFRLAFLIVPAALFALPSGVSMYRETHSLYHVIGYYSWAFSLWAEALAVLPQMFLIQRCKKVDVIPWDSIFFMSIYRALYLLSWIYRLIRERETQYAVVYLSGILQTVIYIDYIFHYGKTKIKGGNPDLPK
jgi:ER lumen protein retaining receptor